MFRQKKRVIIIGIYFVIFLVVVGFVFSLMTPKPTCFDGKKNQNETGVDCGGVCIACDTELQGEDLVIKDSYVVYGGEGQYDVAANIHNPNPLFGGEKVYYTIEILDANENVLDSRKGKTFIMPNENKYVVEVSLESSVQPVKVQTTIEKVEWVKFTDFDSPEIIVTNKRVGLVENSINFARAYGLVVNNSPYDFHDVTINVIVLDERGVPIAINKTSQRTLNAGDQREFILNWPHTFSGEIKDSIMQTETNIFDSQNFMKKYLPSGRHQERTDGNSDF
jgi:hypothetical protein